MLGFLELDYQFFPFRLQLSDPCSTTRGRCETYLLYLLFRATGFFTLHLPLGLVCHDVDPTHSPVSME